MTIHVLVDDHPLMVLPIYLRMLCYLVVFSYSSFISGVVTWVGVPVEDSYGYICYDLVGISWRIWWSCFFLMFYVCSLVFDEISITLLVWARLGSIIEDLSVENVQYIYTELLVFYSDSIYVN